MSKPDGGTAHTERFAISYGMLERLLVRLVDGSQNSVASRFRKLRPKFADDGLLTKPGNRVSYDLSRTLAIGAIYQINQLTIPQGHAVDLVVTNWPEIANGCLNAWGEATRTSSIVRIFVDAFQSAEDGQSAPASWATVTGASPCNLPHISIDCRMLVDELESLVEATGTDREPLAEAFNSLQRDFGALIRDGNEAPPIPSRAEPGFFGSGPYFQRARALLSPNLAASFGKGERARLQAYLNYLENPAPIDSWKRFIGTEPGSGRLVHMLAAWGAELGLASKLIGNVNTLRDATLSRDGALDLIERGEARLSCLIGGSSSIRVLKT